MYAEVDADADSLRDKSSVGYFYFLPTNNNFRSHHLSFGILPLSNNTIMQLVLVAIVNNNNNNNIRVEWKHEIEGTNCGPGTALAALGTRHSGRVVKVTSLCARIIQSLIKSQEANAFATMFIDCERFIRVQGIFNSIINKRRRRRQEKLKLSITKCAYFCFCFCFVLDFFFDVFKRRLIV